MALRNGVVPRKAKNQDGSLTVPALRDIWSQYAPAYSRKKFSKRLGDLRKIVGKEMAPSGIKEPKPKWDKSGACKLLERDIRKGLVPLEAPEEDDWEIIYLMHPEYAKYDDNLFKGRLKALRKAASKDSSRASDDQDAFDAFIQRHPVNIFSHKGYEQWQGSAAQRTIWEDILLDKHRTMRKRDLYGSRAVYYEHFPLKTFRDNLRQEIKTEKWRHTLEVKGKQYKAS